MAAMTSHPGNNHDDPHDAYQVAPFPKLRRALALMYPAVQRAHKVRGLIEVDVTDARQYLRSYQTRTGDSLSFTGFIAGCVAHAADEDKMLNACRAGGGRLVLFRDVDVAIPIEHDVDIGHRMGRRKQAIVYIVRAANRKSVLEVTREMRAARVASLASLAHAWEGFAAERWIMPIPLFILKVMWAFFWWLRGRSPRLQKRYGGTVGLTAVGMFAIGGGWAIPLDYHTLDVALGGIAEKPGVVDGKIAIREYLCVTLSFDHDIVDGAPGARFVSRLRELIESGYGLHDEIPVAVHEPVESAQA
jgi:pyruvate/2-oxoglutarate dehydrogenase complex dihydrolipoamide acyltransferase (E2) component